MCFGGGGGGGCSFSGFVFACVNPLAVRYTQEKDVLWERSVHNLLKHHVPDTMTLDDL